MKFGKELSTKSIPAWREHYCSYKKLKRVLKRIKAESEKEAEEIPAPSANEQQALLNPSERVVYIAPRARTEFFTTLEEDLKKIRKFFAMKEGEVVAALEEFANKIEKSDLSVKKVIRDARIEGADLYKQLDDLKHYVNLNYEGLRKIAKKFDKTTGERICEDFTARLQKEPWATQDFHLDCLANRAEALYLGLFEESERERAMSELSELLTGAAQHPHKIKFMIKPFPMCIAIAVFLIIFVIPIFPDQPRAHRCAALVGFVTVMWATEAAPFFSTSLLIPPLVVFLKILADPNDVTSTDPLVAPTAVKVVLAKMFDDVLLLVIGGFTISKAIAKFHFEQRLAAAILDRVGTRPRLFMLAVMILGYILSMWMSNVAAPVLLNSFMLPIVHDLPSNSRYLKSVLLGLAFSCNIGGMATPISSPQNAVALQALQSVTGLTISFPSWLSVSFPLGAMLVPLCWGFLLWMGRPLDVHYIPPLMVQKTPMAPVHWVVLGTSGLTIILWCTLAVTENFFGDLGIIALIPVVTFFASGILTKDDFNEFSWHLVFLLSGGSVLGLAVSNSQLLNIIGNSIFGVLQGYSNFVIALVFIGFVTIVTTFVSHTVAALILMPMVCKIGQQVGHVKLLLMTSTLMCSGTMMLPMSSFPNVNAILTEDDYGSTYLKPLDFIINGGIFSFIIMILVATLGYALCLAVGM